MNSNIFQNDNTVGNSIMGFEIKGVFKEDDDKIIEQLKSVFNRDVLVSNIKYKLLEPSDTNIVFMEDGKSRIIKTSMYSYFEAIYLLPKIFEFTKNFENYNNTYFNIKVGFNKDYLDITQLNMLKFVFNFNEKEFLTKLSNQNRQIFKSITDIKPMSLDQCDEPIQKQINSLKFLDERDNPYGISFTNLNSGHITLKYTRDINYSSKWEDIMKMLNHTIKTIYNTTKNPDFTKEEIEKIEKLNETNKKYESALGCYDLFKNEYKSMSVMVDLDTDKSKIDMIFPTIKNQLFNIVVLNEIKSAKVNYDSDISRLQIKDIDIKNCHHLENVDIVSGDIENSHIKNCDFYDTNIKNSTIKDCNLFGYANCSKSSFEDCFISQNISLKDCNVTGKLGKMGGSMKGGSIKDTTILVDLANIENDVEKENINEIH